MNPALLNPTMVLLPIFLQAKVRSVRLPNTQVKPDGAGGTARVAAWEISKSLALNESPHD